VEAVKYAHEYYQRKYCSDKCYRRALSRMFRGRKLSARTRRKLSEARKRLFTEGRIAPHTLGGVPLRAILSMMERARGVRIDRDGIVIVDSMKGKLSHEEAVEKAIEKLTELGYKCIDITRRPLPDIIAFKDGEVFAVEVERCYFNTKKYIGAKNPFDDVLWVLFGRWKKAPAIIIRNSAIRGG